MILERRQGTYATRKLDESTPCGCWEMEPDEFGITQDEPPTEDDEQDECQVEQEDCICCYSVNHQSTGANSYACGFA